MNFFRRFRETVIVGVLLALPFFFLHANLRDPAQATLVDRVVLRASAPIQWVATQAARGVTDVLEEYTYLVDVRADNERLRTENARLREDVARLETEARDNARLRDMLGLRDQLGGDQVFAEVIGKEVSANFRVVRIRVDRGERDRVREGMPVVTPEGLVGQIRRTFGRYADVQLVVDRESRVDIAVQRNGARGMLVGTGQDDRYLCRIQYLLRADEVRVGDVVETSGFGHRFPAHIVVGRVTHVTRRDFGLYQEAEVTPAVSFADFENVSVLLTGSREQLAQEAAGHRDEAAGDL